MRGLVSLILFFALSVGAITVLWDRNTETSVVGYKIYRGTAPRTYDFVLDVGNEISGVVPIEPLVTNYFAVTAYDSSGLESDYSNEIFYFSNATNIITNSTNAPITNAIFQVKMNIRKGQDGMEIYFDAKANIQYTLDITTDFINWYTYLTTSRESDQQIIIPLPVMSGNKGFYRVSYNPN